MNECFGIQESLILDNNFCKTNRNIKPLEYLEDIDASKLTVLFTAGNPEIQHEVMHSILQYCDESQILKIFPITGNGFKTECGKHSYGPLCEHHLVERVGAFCSFAQGSNVLRNHPTEYLSTHPFIYMDINCNSIYPPYQAHEDEPWLVKGIVPKGKNEKMRRITIGNDVWLGHNVLITNGVNIGNGVIAGAGAVITKDVPDYAVVVGVPAKVLRYRYTPEQIEKLNEIAWWDWSDDKIRECYDDFFIDIDEFILKHYKK